MTRILLFFALASLCNKAYAQQYYSDHGNPIVDPKPPCTCREWYIEKNVVTYETKIVLIEHILIYGIRYKRTHYITESKTTVYAICTKPSNCKGATENWVTIKTHPWYQDTRECDNLQPGQVCCNGNILKPGEVCCVDKVYEETIYPITAAMQEGFWSYVDQSVQAIRHILNKMPFKLEISKPELSGIYSKRNCCRNNTEETKDGETKMNASISLGLKATDIPIKVSPFSGSWIIQDIEILGYRFSVNIKCGMSASADAKLTSSMSYEKNTCIPRECYKAYSSMGFGVTLATQATLSACLTKYQIFWRQCMGVWPNGARCTNSTKNACDYCDYHTNQSPYCSKCLNFSLKTALSAKFTLSHIESCNQIPQSHLIMDPLVLECILQLWRFDYKVTLPISNGIVFF